MELFVTIAGIIVIVILVLQLASILHVNYMIKRIEVRKEDLNEMANGNSTRLSIFEVIALPLFMFNAIVLKDPISLVITMLFVGLILSKKQLKQDANKIISNSNM